jgi:hypothetical protein
MTIHDFAPLAAFLEVRHTGCVLVASCFSQVTIIGNVNGDARPAWCLAPNPLWFAQNNEP